MEMKVNTTNKAELARRLKVSRAYVTMLCNGKRNLSKKLQKKVNKLGLTNSLKNLNGVQVAGGSNPPTPTSKTTLQKRNLILYNVQPLNVLFH
jgi:transcriptional regulator with XRE-family HTH domain